MNVKRTVVIFLFLWALPSWALAQSTVAQFAQTVVRIDATIKPSARTIDILGFQRSGSGVVVDATGLIVTVGYLVLESSEVLITFGSDNTVPAEVVVNDTATGLALLRAELPSDVVPLSLGDSHAMSVEEDVVVLPYGGTDAAHVTRIADIRSFAGSWEYLIDRAFYTAPATRMFSGAALINRDAELIGIGSLLLSDISAGRAARSINGNMFIPIEHLRSNLGQLLSGNPSVAPRPWLGATLNESVPDLEIVRVADESPAAVAGLQASDKIIAIDNIRVTDMAGLYQRLWAGNVGDTVSLLVAREDKVMPVVVTTADRSDWFR